METKAFMKRAVIGCVVAFALACGGTTTPEPSPDAEACEHLKEGPATSVTAAAMNGPAVSNDHRRYDVTLAETNGQRGGQVTFAAAEQADHAFFLGKDIPVAFASASGGAIEPESVVKSSTECAEIKAKYIVPLEVGTYTLTFGPTTETTVGVVVEETALAHE